jgi:hypothetical protein
VADVRAARFPESRHTYTMLPGEVELFQAELAGLSSRAALK